MIDYWAGANKACMDMGMRMVTSAELANLNTLKIAELSDSYYVQSGSLVTKAGGTLQVNNRGIYGNCMCVKVK